ncbi:non-specific lipid-transfer protein 2 [Cucumis melo var. makuwa]|nr:non-specific lipid-transfer protein 2 [Cucumis melo var. makuwa]
MKTSRIGSILMIVGAILLISNSNEVMVEGADQVACNPMQMSSCMNSIVSGTPPSSQCCSKIKEQKPCLCGYLKNPFLKSFVSSPNARKVANDCGTPFPNC